MEKIFGEIDLITNNFEDVNGRRKRWQWRWWSIVDGTGNNGWWETEAMTMAMATRMRIFVTNKRSDLAHHNSTTFHNMPSNCPLSHSIHTLILYRSIPPLKMIFFGNFSPYFSVAYLGIFDYFIYKVFFYPRISYNWTNYECPSTIMLIN